MDLINTNFFDQRKKSEQEEIVSPTIHLMKKISQNKAKSTLQRLKKSLMQNLPNRERLRLDVEKSE